jgi:hypothetical protein
MNLLWLCKAGYHCINFGIMSMETKSLKLQLIYECTNLSLDTMPELLLLLLYGARGSVVVKGRGFHTR